jgi:tRNA nucleotidyltransferase (CCA-adding enzyme)
VEAAASLARERGESLYLVGGAVRDLLLARPVRDVDLALEGDALGFAGELSARLGAAVSARHARFGTATLSLPEGGRLDLASTRRETYARPGALPEVEPGAPILADLERRDFPANAMAIALTGTRRLLDPFGGRSDLAARRIRFLHDASPADDPTRALRAARYAGRLGFRLDSGARAAIRAAIARGAFDAVSGERLRRELALLLEEDGRGRSLTLLHAAGVDGAISPVLAAGFAGAARRLRNAATRGTRAGAAPGWLCYLLVWMAPMTRAGALRLADRLALAGADRAAALRWPQTRRAIPPGFAGLPRSRQRARLEGRSRDEALAAAALLPGRDASAILSALGRPGARLSISGADLIARGIAPGPAIGRALGATLAALEDGRIGAKDELAFALRRARRKR